MPVKGYRKPKEQKQIDWNNKIEDAKQKAEQMLADMSSEIVIRDQSIFQGDIPAEQKLYAAVAYTVTGSSRKAAALLQSMFDDKSSLETRASTIRMWKKEAKWWDEAVRATWASIGDKVQSKISTIIQKSLDVTQDRLEKGDEVVLQKTGEIIRKGVSAKDAATIGAIMIDKQQLLQGNPTSRVEHRSQEDNLKDLQKQFKQFTQAKTIEAEVIKED